MRELLLADDIVLINFVETLLAGRGIQSVVFDRHANALHGAVGTAPQRVMVADADWPRAAALLEEAGLGHWIRLEEG